MTELFEKHTVRAHPQLKVEIYGDGVRLEDQEAGWNIDLSDSELRELIHLIKESRPFEIEGGEQ